MNTTIPPSQTPEDDDWGLYWLEAWLICCDKAIDNFLLTVQYGSPDNARVFLEQFKRAKDSAIQNMQERAAASLSLRNGETSTS